MPRSRCLGSSSWTCPCRSTCGISRSARATARRTCGRSSWRTGCESKTVELRADVLACVTRHWLRDDDTLNLYGWWPDNRKPPVVIFSCAGFDDLKAEGPDTDRAIANVTVTALAGFFGETGHARARRAGLSAVPQSAAEVRAPDRSAEVRQGLPREAEEEAAEGTACARGVAQDIRLVWCAAWDGKER